MNDTFTAFDPLENLIRDVITAAALLDDHIDTALAGNGERRDFAARVVYYMMECLIADLHLIEEKYHDAMKSIAGGAE